MPSGFSVTDPLVGEHHFRVVGVYRGFASASKRFFFADAAAFFAYVCDMCCVMLRIACLLSLDCVFQSIAVLALFADVTKKAWR